jgi:hypothetical protein
MVRRYEQVSQPCCLLAGHSLASNSNEGWGTRDGGVVRREEHLVALDEFYAQGAALQIGQRADEASVDQRFVIAIACLSPRRGSP